MTNRTRLFGLPRISPAPSDELTIVGAELDDDMGFPAPYGEPAPDEETSLLVPPAEQVSAPEGSDEPMSSRSSAGRHRTFRLAVPGPLGSVPHLRWLALGIAVVVGVALFMVAATGKPAHRSGLPWASGVYPLDGTSAGAAAFAAWRGRQLDVVDAWSARATWAQIDDPTWLYQRWQGEPYTMAFGVPMLPENVSGVSLQACADGAYDAYWREFGTVISSYGLGALDHSAGLGVQRQLVCMAGDQPRHVGALLAADRHLRTHYRPEPAVGLGRQPRGVGWAGQSGPRVSGQRLREHDRGRQL